jgi:hypothetical protein
VCEECVLSWSAGPDPVLLKAVTWLAELDLPSRNDPPVAAVAVPVAATKSARYATMLAWLGRRSSLTGTP